MIIAKRLRKCTLRMAMDRGTLRAPSVAAEAAPSDCRAGGARSTPRRRALRQRDPNPSFPIPGSRPVPPIARCEVQRYVSARRGSLGLLNDGPR